MNPLNHSTLEASRRLADAGIVLETEAVWIYVPIVNMGGKDFWEWRLIPKKDMSYHLGCKSVPAPSMAETWRELPEFIDSGNHRYRKSIYTDGGLSCCWYSGYTESRYKNTNPTDALIDLLIWVKGQEKTCNTCANAFEGTCTECAGDNYGHTTEISGNGSCRNWLKEQKGKEKVC